MDFNFDEVKKGIFTLGCISFNPTLCGKEFSEQHKDFKYKPNERVYSCEYDNDNFKIGNHTFYAHIEFYYKTDKILWMQLDCKDKNYELTEESLNELQRCHENILKEWGLSSSNKYRWGVIVSSRDSHSYDPHIYIVFRKNYPLFSALYKNK